MIHEEKSSSEMYNQPPPQQSRLYSSKQTEWLKFTGPGSATGVKKGGEKKVKRPTKGAWLLIKTKARSHIGNILPTQTPSFYSGVRIWLALNFLKVKRLNYDPCCFASSISRVRISARRHQQIGKKFLRLTTIVCFEMSGVAHDSHLDNSKQCKRNF